MSRYCGFYVLDADHNVVALDDEDIILWGTFFGDRNNRRVAWDELIPGVVVSTAFIGIDHNFGRMFGDNDDPPILFETMVTTDYRAGPIDWSDPPDWDNQVRYATWHEAVAGHQAMVEHMRSIIATATFPVADKPDDEASPPADDGDDSKP